jgi:hypothetical protein
MAAGRHNLTRRALLGAVVGASALPGAVVGASALPGAVAGAATLPGARGAHAADARRPWERALAAFRRAEARLDARRAYEAGLPAALRAFPLSEQLDEVFNDLACARLRALQRLLQVPAPDLGTLSLKVDLIVDEEVATLHGDERCLAVLKADARRLAQGG